MKRKFLVLAAVISVLLLCILLVSCKPSPVKIKTFSGKGPGLSLMNIGDMFDGLPVTLEKDERGNIAKATFTSGIYGFDEVLTHTCEYDEAGNLKTIRQISTLFNSLEVGRVEYIYEGGRAVRADYYAFCAEYQGSRLNAYANIMFLTPDMPLHSILISSCIDAVNPENSLEILLQNFPEYDSSGKLIKVTSKQADGKTYCTYYIKDNKYYTDYGDGKERVVTYHENGQLGSISDYSNGKLYESRSFNEKGLLIQSVSYNTRDVLATMFEFEYDEDDYLKSVYTRTDIRQSDSRFDKFTGKYDYATTEFEYGENLLKIYQTKNGGDRKLMRTVTCKALDNDIEFKDGAVLFTVIQQRSGSTAYVCEIAYPSKPAVDLRTFNFDLIRIPVEELTGRFSNGASRFLNKYGYAPGIGNITAIEAVSVIGGNPKSGAVTYYISPDNTTISDGTYTVGSKDYIAAGGRGPLSESVAASLFGYSGINSFDYALACYQRYTGSAKVNDLTLGSERLFIGDVASRTRFYEKDGYTVKLSDNPSFDAETLSVSEELGSDYAAKYTRAGSDAKVIVVGYNGGLSAEYSIGRKTVTFCNETEGKLDAYKVNNKFYVGPEETGVAVSKVKQYSFEKTESKTNMSEDDAVSYTITLSGMLALEYDASFELSKVYFLESKDEPAGVYIQSVEEESSSGFYQVVECVHENGLYVLSGYDAVAATDEEVEDALAVLPEANAFVDGLPLPPF